MYTSKAIEKNIVIPSVPRSFNDLNKWRGESDYQAFWHLYHNTQKEIPLTLPARMIFNELEISRVELLGSSEYVGSKKNISEYLNQKSISMSSLDDKKSFNILAYGANLWLKKQAKFKLSEKSLDIIKIFEEKYGVNSSLNYLSEGLIENIDDQKKFEKLSVQFLQKLNLIDDTNDEDENLDPDQVPESNEEFENNEIEINSETLEDNEVGFEASQAEIDVDSEDFSKKIDDTSIQEEIETSTYPENEFTNKQKKDYSIYTTNFDEIIEAKDLVTSDESIRLKISLII